MGNKSPTPSKLEDYNQTKNIPLEKFQQETFRKMTCHILSNKVEDCIRFIELFSKENLKGSKVLLEKNIEKKINLYSFMNYIAYEDPSELMKQIKDKIKNITDNLNSKDAIYSEVIIILENEKINFHLDEIRTKVKEIKNHILFHLY